MKKKARVLQDHKQKKKVLVPPLLHALGENYKPYSWVKELIPELFWIALLQKQFGLKLGVELATVIGKKAGEVCCKLPLPMFVKASSFLELSDQEKIDLSKVLDAEEYISDIRSGLSPLMKLVPSYPLKFLFEQLDDDAEIPAEVAEVLEDLYNRQSVIATHTQATAIHLGFTQDKIKIAVQNSPLSNFAAIEEYPNTEESKILASSLRAMVGVFLVKDNMSDAQIDTSWVESFWTKVSGIGECIVTESSNYDHDEEPEDELGKIVFRFCNAAKAELNERVQKWGFDLNEAEKYEVIGGLLARQTTLAVDLAMSPMAWTPSASPLFHRAMADVFIVLSWIFKNPQERSMKFIETGIGDAKLEVAHRKKRMQEDGRVEDPQEMKMTDIYERWISSQRLEALVEVNLANWSGLTTRQMAVEADCLDFYNYVYQPFSAAVHSSWMHISLHNLKYCENPAHRNHSLPLSPDYQPTPYFLALSGKYLQKAFAKFDEETGVKTSSISAYDQLYDDIYGPDDDQE